MWRKIIDIFRENQNKFYLGLFGIVTVSGLAYLTYRNIKTLTAKSHISTDSEHPEDIEKEEIRFGEQDQSKVFAQVVNNIKNVILRNQDFELAGVRAIYEGYHELSGREYRRLAKESKRKRRAKMEEIEKYWQILIHYEKEIEAARMRSLISILSFFKVELIHWFALTSKYSEEYKQEWREMLILTDVMQLTSLQEVAKKPMASQLLLAVFQYKESILEGLLAAVERIEWKTSEDLVIFADRRVTDLVALKFGVEDEDIFLSMIAMDPKTKEIVEASEALIRNRLNDFVDGKLKERKKE